MTGFHVDLNRKINKIKPMHGVGNAPLLGCNNMLFHYLGEAGIPYSRLHDTGGNYAGGCFVDIANIFRNFDADPGDPASYDFAFTDWLIAELEKQQVQPFYRLGASIECEHYIRAYHIYPPKDYQKWAEICSGIIRHYNEGWAGGFHYGIQYWEIWNEPDNEPEIRDNPMWKGTKEDFFRLYEVTSNTLKTQFPHLKIGGYGSCGFYAISDSAFSANANSSHRVEYFLEFFHDFLKYITAPEHKCPLDFFSWHSYMTIEKNISYAEYARKILDSYGFTETESILNEWNMGPDLRGTLKDASYISGMISAMQNTPIDKMMYYDAQIHANYGGLFDPVRKTVFKSYYAFQAFNVLYQMKNQADCSGSCEKDVTALAAVDDSGQCGAVLVTNTNPAPVRISFTLTPTSGLQIGELTCLATDAAHDFTETEAYQYDSAQNRIDCELPEHSFYLFRIRQK
ncbi:MAG: GH39 family glycosyl hydrolase [Clostridia bacterium]